MTVPNGSSDSQVPAQHAEPDLSEFDDEYAAVKPADNGEVPDGKYHARLQDAQLGRSQRGNPMITYNLVVLSGPHAKRHIFKNAVITDASLPFIKADLKTLGLKLKRFSDLPNRLGEVVGRALEITKRTKDEYVNVYFNKRIPAPVPEAGQSDDVPF
jgi:hypothetical protein